MTKRDDVDVLIESVACLLLAALLLWAALAEAQPTSLNLNGQPLTAIRCDGGIVCARLGSVGYVYGSGASSSSPAPPVDAGFVVWSAAASTGSTNERVLTAGTNITLGTGTPGQLIVNASGGGSGDFDGGYLVVEDEGAPLTKRTTVDFTGAGVTCTDTGSKTACDIPGGGSGGASPLSLILGTP